MKKILLFVIFIVVVCLLLKGIANDRERYIQDWATRHNYTVVSMEPNIFDWGPYSIVNIKDSLSVYRVVMSNGKIFWFRFWFSSADVEEYNR